MAADAVVVAQLSSPLQQSVPSGWTAALRRLGNRGGRQAVCAGREQQQDLARNLSRTLVHGDAKVANFAILPGPARRGVRLGDRRRRPVHDRRRLVSRRQRVAPDLREGAGARSLSLAARGGARPTGARAAVAQARRRLGRLRRRCGSGRKRWRAAADGPAPTPSGPGGWSGWNDETASLQRGGFFFRFFFSFNGASNWIVEDNTIGFSA